MTNRPFAYNPQIGSPVEVIPGTIQVGDLAIGVDPLLYSADPGGVTWWAGPDEEVGYVICAPVPAEDHPTPVGPVGSVRFWRTKALTTEAFISLANYISSKVGFGVEFTTAAGVLDKLEEVGYWTSFVPIEGSVFNQVWNDAETWKDTDVWAD